MSRCWPKNQHLAPEANLSDGVNDGLTVLDQRIHLLRGEHHRVGHMPFVPIAESCLLLCHFVAKNADNRKVVGTAAFQR